MHEAFLVVVKIFYLFKNRYLAMAEYSFCTLSLCKIFQLETKPTAMGLGGGGVSTAVGFASCKWQGVGSCIKTILM